MAAPTGATNLNKSNLTSQLEHGDTGSLTPTGFGNGTGKNSSKLRSLSDVPNHPLGPTLSPSPAIRESPNRRVSKDDIAVTDPVTPRRPAYHMRGLSLQMPTKPADETAVSRVPLSPKLDPTSTYGSPASVLPRRSRGLDFARACTNLHHSTLAESSPDASPITGRGIQIPQRRSIHNSTVMESPSQGWPSVYGERTNLSSSVSSINMLDSDSDSDVSSDMAVDRDYDDPMLNTPAASRLNALAAANSPGMEWMNNNQPTNSQISLLNFQPNRLSFRKHRGLRNNKSSQSSSSVSIRSSKPSPGPLSPPIRPSVESSGYFNLTRQQVRSRRESLSLGTDDLVLSDSEWDGDNKMNINAGNSGNDASSERGVIRRAVTRRSNLLPKTKGFARIRAALMEESDPLQSEARRESEVIKQVQESDENYNSRTGNVLDTTTTAEPLEASIETALSNAFSDAHSQPLASEQTTTEPFSTTAKRNSGGLGFWNTFEHTPPNNIDRYRTPPPPSLSHNDSNASDDTMTTNTTNSQYTDSAGPAGSLIRHLHNYNSRSRSRSTTPLASQNTPNNSNNTNQSQTQSQTQPPTAGDVARKVNNKRRRDDDFDPASFKRRAVSPGMMSAQSSPVVPQSPTLNNDRSWGRPPPKTHGDRSNSGSSVREGSGGGGGAAGGAPKRIGLQGMTEASDGFMSMSID
ncbi:hypothetical protein ES702_00498 [subsurface metagenome]